MKKVYAILLEKEDFRPNTVAPHWQARLTPEAAAASLEADIVLYDGEVIKNRRGKITSPGPK